MNIAILSVHSCPLGRLGSKDTGGMSVYVRELARELGKRGHHVDVFTRLHDPRDGQIVPLGENARLIHLRVGEIREIPKLDVYPYLNEFTIALEDFRKNNDLHYQLIHSHYWLSGWGGRQLQSWWSVPHFIMFHTLGATKNAIGVGENEPDIRIETERELVHDCQRIIAATKREKNELIQYYGASAERISVVPCGVNLQIFKPEDKFIARRKLGLKGKNIILYVGRIEALKGINNLLSSIPYLKDKKEIELVVVGGDQRSQSELEKLKATCHTLEIEDMVKFVGTVNQEELPAYYCAADVCVVPSYHESFGLVPLESLACGTPVVATRVGGVAEFIIPGRNGYIVENNDPRILAQKISEVLSPSFIINNSAGNIRQSVSSFSWSNMTETIIKEYQTALTAAIV